MKSFKCYKLNQDEMFKAVANYVRDQGSEINGRDLLVTLRRRRGKYIATAYLDKKKS